MTDAVLSSVARFIQLVRTFLSNSFALFH